MRSFASLPPVPLKVSAPNESGDKDRYIIFGDAWFKDRRLCSERVLGER